MTHGEERALRESIRSLLEAPYTPEADWRAQQDAQREAAIESLVDEPIYQNVEDFFMDRAEGDGTYDAIELQALARNLTRQRTGQEDSLAHPDDVATVRRTLEGPGGLKFTGQASTKYSRGVTSSINGRHPHAGTGGGGSGMGPSGFRAHGGGVGVVCGGYPWERDDKRSLP